MASGDGYDIVGTHTYAATGTFTVRTTVEKTNGVRATTTSTATVVDRPDFTVSISPGSAGVRQGQSARFTVAVTPLAGFIGTVSLTLSGASGSFAPQSLVVPGSSVLTVATQAATVPSAYPLTVTATSGALSRTATATLTVTRSAPDGRRGAGGPTVRPSAVADPLMPAARRGQPGFCGTWTGIASRTSSAARARRCWSPVSAYPDAEPSA